MRVINKHYHYKTYPYNPYSYKHYPHKPYIPYKQWQYSYWYSGYVFVLQYRYINILHESPKEALHFFNIKCRTENTIICINPLSIRWTWSINHSIFMPVWHVHVQITWLYTTYTHLPQAHKHTHVICTHTEKVRQEQKLFTVSLMGKSLEVDSCMELFL